MSRLSRFVLLFVMTLLLIQGIAPANATAQDATPTAEQMVLPAWLEAWITAYETEDIQGFADLYAVDGASVDIPSGKMWQGHMNLVAMASSSAGYQEDYAITPIALHQGEGWAVFEYSVSAVDTMTSKPFAVQVATMFELADDGTIQRSTDYYDTLGIQEQFGMTLVEAATPTP